MKKIYYIIIAVLLIIALTTAYDTYKLYGGKWVCITKVCTAYAEGDEWISHNCRPRDVNGNQELVCEILKDGKNIYVPLSMIDIAKVRSCKDYICASEVFARGYEKTELMKDE